MIEKDHYQKKCTEFIRCIAEIREIAHAGQKSSRPLSDGYEYIGLLGEFVFAQKFGFPIDLSIKPMGDGRKDFTTSVGTLDVKTARKAYNLLREVDKDHADILVLAQYYDDLDWIRLVGWEYDLEMAKCPYRDFGYGIINYYKSASELRPMEELERLLANR